MKRLGRAFLLMLGIAALTSAGVVQGQTVYAQRPKRVVVGSPGNPAGTDRVDGARTGMARLRLPSEGLRVAWRASVGISIQHAPVVDAEGAIYVVGTNGEVVAIGPDGIELWRATTGAAQPSAATLLSDNTLVFVDDAGEAVGVRARAVRWRTRFGRGSGASPAPLSLDDGGVIVATSREIAALDAEGRERGRAALPEQATAPLVAALGKAVIVTASGAVWKWGPGEREPARVGTFGQGIEGGAALADERTLVAVSASRTRLAAIDLLTGALATRGVATEGPWLGAPAMRGGFAYLIFGGGTGEVAAVLDPGGNELARGVLAARTRASRLDGGASPPLRGLFTPPLVDAVGTLVFATSEGAVGAVSWVPGAPSPLPSPAPPTAPERVEVLTDACPPGGGTPTRSDWPVAGIAPLLSGGFVAACRSGAVVAVQGRL